MKNSRYFLEVHDIRIGSLTAMNREKNDVVLTIVNCLVHRVDTEEKRVVSSPFCEGRMKVLGEHQGVIAESEELVDVAGVPNLIELGCGEECLERQIDFEELCFSFSSGSKVRFSSGSIQVSVSPTGRLETTWDGVLWDKGSVNDVSFLGDVFYF